MREIAALRNENAQLKGGGHAAGIQTPARPGNAQHSPPPTMTPAAGTAMATGFLPAPNTGPIITPQLQPLGQLDTPNTGAARPDRPYLQGGHGRYEASDGDSDLQRQAKALLNKWSRESLFGNDQDCWETTATTRSTPTSGASCRRRMSSVARSSSTGLCGASGPLKRTESLPGLSLAFVPCAFRLPLSRSSGVGGGLSRTSRLLARSLTPSQHRA